MKALRLITLVSVFSLFLLPGCSHCNRKDDSIYQASTIDALLVGTYDGSTSFADLKRNGDFGIGTFDALDGEMIALDGTFYQAKADGTVLPVADSARTPFAVVKFFAPETTLPLAAAPDLNNLMRQLDALLPSANYFYALKIEGTFPAIKVRSVPAQQKPYPGLAEAASRQTVFQFQALSGTIVGFRTPGFAKGINLPGYHFHFISADRKIGGHLLDCRIDNALLSLDKVSELHLALPENAEFSRGDLGQDHGRDLEKAER
ncbi:MAG: acetolactate decarboxylase [Geobacter sp.]|nr:MAG: acetolactate decarboxylase [Geobacter sp.]